MRVHKNEESKNAKKEGQEAHIPDSDRQILNSQNAELDDCEKKTHGKGDDTERKHSALESLSAVNPIRIIFEAILSFVHQSDVMELPIKKIVVAIISFVSNIVSFFRDRNRLRKLQEDSNRIAVSIKEKRENGDYRVINCIYDKAKEELVTPEEDAVMITSKQLDAETQRNFGSKDMIILQ